MSDGICHQFHTDWDLLFWVFIFVFQIVFRLVFSNFTHCNVTFHTSLSVANLQLYVEEENSSSSIDGYQHNSMPICGEVNIHISSSSFIFVN